MNPTPGGFPEQGNHSQPSPIPPPTAAAYLHSGAKGILGRQLVCSLQDAEGVRGLRPKLWVTGGSDWPAGVGRSLCQGAKSQETLPPSAR